jgi:two-component sensor histidine kinase
MRLVENLCQQIGATVGFARKDGTEVVIEIPAAGYSA